jgi:two-component system, NarL family, invasion response regulator UvrY
MQKQLHELKMAVVDDHSLFRKGLINLVHSLDERFKVIIEAANGKELIEQLNTNCLPDIILMDINMPELNGFDAVHLLQKSFPQIDILVVSMVEKEESIVRMLKLGVKGYLSKDVEPHDLKQAILSIKEKGYYYTDFITGRLLHDLRKDDTKDSIRLTDKERNFLELACSELTYKQIADKMNVSFKTVDIYRDNLFKKFDAVSRVGLVIQAIKRGLIELS